MFSQNGNCIAIGFNAGMTGQGVNAIAIGSAAGMTGQAANTIVINATGTVVNSGTQNACYIAPIRDSSGTFIGGVNGNVVSSYPLYYNPTTFEIQSRSTAGSFIYRYNSSTQSIPNATGTTVIFPLTSGSFGDTGLSYSAGTFTNNTTSTLLINANGSFIFGASGTGRRIYNLTHSTMSALSSFTIMPNASNSMNGSVSAVFALQPTESFSFIVFQECGTALNLANASRMTAVLLN